MESTDQAGRVKVMQTVPRRARMLTIFAVIGVFLASIFAATPAYATANTLAAPQGSGVDTALTTHAPQGSEEQRIAERIAQLSSAYDTTTHTLDPRKVPSSTLNSDEGRGFLAAVAASHGDAAAVDQLKKTFAALRTALGVSGSGDSYKLTPGVTLTFPEAGSATPTMSGGADPWPYIQLTGAEQQAMVTGASGTLIAAICALIGAETWGIGCGVGAAVIGMIVGIIVANGVCPNNREMRIYILAGPGGFSCQ